MAELVYAFDLKSNGENHMGSSPISGTNKIILTLSQDYFMSKNFIPYLLLVSQSAYVPSRQTKYA